MVSYAKAKRKDIIEMVVVESKSKRTMTCQLSAYVITTQLDSHSISLDPYNVGLVLQFSN